VLRFEASGKATAVEGEVGVSGEDGVVDVVESSVAGVIVMLGMSVRVNMVWNRRYEAGICVRRESMSWGENGTRRADEKKERGCLQAVSNRSPDISR
jgi:hypothetical protein